jgi:hypothetical protein
MNKLRSTLAYLVPLGLMWPSLIWISVDKSVFTWDPALYGMSAVELFANAIHSPSRWVSDMLATLPSTAPGVSWFGQVFVPLGYLTGSIDRGLLVSIWLTQGLTLLLIYKSLWRLSSQNRLVSITGCLVTASAPLFVGLSHWFLVEPLQLLAVAWFVLIMCSAPYWTRPFTVSQILAAVALAMLAKASSPLYCIGPGVVALWHVVRGGRSLFARQDWLDVSVVITLVVGVSLNTAALAWYSKNLSFVIRHVSLASSGAVAELYGQTDSFGNSLLFWLQATQTSLFLPSVLLVSALLCAFGTVRYFISSHVKVDHFTICCALAVVQISVVLAAFSLNANRDVRFLLPLLPYVALVVSWGVARVDERPATIVVIVMYLAQFTVVHGQSFRYTSQNLPFPYVEPVNLDERQARAVDSIVYTTCSDSRVQGEGNGERYWNIVGDSRPWFNVNTFGYAAAKKFSIEDRVRCSYAGIATYFDADVNAGWNRILSLNPHYYVATDPDTYPIPDDKVSEAISRLNIPLLNRIETSGTFAFQPLREDPGVMIFRRGKLRRQSSDPEASAVAEAGLPVARGVRFGRHFELLGALMTPATQGMELKLAWRCVSAAVLDRNVAVHFVDDSGKILAQSDFPQDVSRASVMPGAEWVDHVFVPAEKLAGALKVAIALYTPGGDVSIVDRGPRDWNQHRLLLPLDKALAASAAAPAGRGLLPIVAAP